MRCRRCTWRWRDGGRKPKQGHKGHQGPKDDKDRKTPVSTVSFVLDVLAVLYVLCFGCPRSGARQNRLLGAFTNFSDADPQALGDAPAVVRVGPQKVAELAQLELAAGELHMLDEVVDEPLFLLFGHQSIEIARLRVVVVRVLIRRARGGAVELEGTLREFGRLLGRIGIAV